MGLQQIPSKGGIPSGNTTSRPGSPVIGDTYYNGQLELLEIYNGTAWVSASSPALIPTITVADVGTGVAYGSAQGLVTFTENDNGSVPLGFTVSSSTGGYTATTTSSTATITVGNNGSYTFSGTAYNNFGTSSASPSVTQTLTTVPEAPTIGTATQPSGTSTDVTVTWTLGNNGGKNISAITITPYLNGTTAQTAATAATTSSTSHTFSGLSVGSSYTFKVKVSNANGTGLESAASNSLTIIQTFSVDFTVVAGGGASGNVQQNSGNYAAAGGGGGGGVRSSVNQTGGLGSLQSAFDASPGTNYTVTVGAGGSSTAGSDSVFANITATGGGVGWGFNNNQSSGGSGGGGGASSLNSGQANGGSGNQGFSGGGYSGVGFPNVQAGGGGGAGGAGNSGNANNNYVGGNGGYGITTTITGNSVEVAGGGGGGESGQSGGFGGGAGGSVANATAGTANTGGGGGGNRATGSNNNSNSRAGGSGVVYIRYPDSKTISVGAGLTANTNTVGNNKVTQFNAGTGNVSWS